LAAAPNASRQQPQLVAVAQLAHHALLVQQQSKHLQQQLQK
jgi:hypothetical protein